MTMHSELWTELEAEAAAATGFGIMKRMLVSEKKCPLYVGIQQPGMKRVFILQVSKEYAPLPEVISDSKGFEFNVLIVGDELHKDSVSLILSAASVEYNDIFASIADDLYREFNGLVGEREIISTFLSRVQLWQAFFEKQSIDGLSVDAQKGLYGELVFFKKHVLSELSGEISLRYWVGADNRQHDFQFGSISVEVKTTSAKQHQKLHIASEQQLDETLIEWLYLFYLSVSLVQNSENTLPALIAVIRDDFKNNGTALSLFNSILLKRGYLDAHEALYADVGYAIRNSGFFRIENEFPRIKEGELRRGVGNVKYSIEVDACSEYTASESQFASHLKEELK